MAKASTDLVVVYESWPDSEKDRAIRKALKEYETGSGFGFGQRDHTATVPNDALEEIVRELEGIHGIKIQKRVGKKWVNASHATAGN